MKRMADSEKKRKIYLVE